MTLLEAVSVAQRGQKVCHGSRVAVYHDHSMRWLDDKGNIDSYVVVDDYILDDGWKIVLDPRRFSIEEAIPLMRSGRWMRPADTDVSWFSYSNTDGWVYKNSWGSVTRPTSINIVPGWIDRKWEMQP